MKHSETFLKFPSTKHLFYKNIIRVNYSRTYLWAFYIAVVFGYFFFGFFFYLKKLIWKMFFFFFFLGNNNYTHKFPLEHQGLFSLPNLT